ncbi:hypothetical protein SKAU_G00347560 [Synaphobranchus kaupii]|uniref:Uncharacterized protein n=1 Tax=Synaphobranchus kaupii TaxID=118154 RepID=A0A9Q1IFQ0_SYNKA|nr:hypothetical protein SKAU_G00347560 [Synaphobranchus kaupii]
MLNPLQFAYKANSSALNIYQNIPELLHVKLSQLTVPDPTCQWMTAFLTDRRQHLHRNPSGLGGTRGRARPQCIVWSATHGIQPARPPAPLRFHIQEALKITAEPSHPGHRILQALPAGKLFQAIGDKNSFFPLSCGPYK